MFKPAQSESSTIAIRAEPLQLDPNLCKFSASRQLHSGGSFFFETRERGAGSPLIERLFQIDGVTNVLVTENIVMVGKRPDVAWQAIMKSIGAAIRAQLLSGVPAILEHPLEGSVGRRSDTEIRQVVASLLDREINPSVASHGGKISIVDVKDRDLLIAMSGGCQGCASSQATLKQGVEIMVRRVVPEIRNIIDTTDHAAGARPYYKR
jgi:Fe-S cluster biogenesis protein NfuA